MAKISLAGFKDPVRRPRFIVWTFVVVLALAAFVVVMLGATSTRWFCSEVCHKVQDDTIAAYAASSHAEISCMACHEPVGADTITFMIAKVKSGLEVIPTVGNTFSLPLNPGSALALKGGKEMGSQQCTQCHSMKRVVTASEGLVVNHKVHADAGVWCTVCHNRIAHNDTAVKPVLVAPNGTKNVVHPNFMKMEFCFRCHDLEGKVKMTGQKAAPGVCTTCHPAGFELVPETHKAADWAGAAHGEAAKELLKEIGALEVEAKVLEEEGIAPYLAAPVNLCDTCHVESKFCQACHDKLKVSTTP
jgi:nitrate/TMAO reductase-like tetraheme cytochrome c subunit